MFDMNDPRTKPSEKPADKEVAEEIIDELEGMEIEDLLPTMNVSNMTPEQPEQKECIVQDAQLLDLYDEILSNCRTDRESVDEILVNFIDMVMNDGDASSASKEAIVNLLKIKTDISDKMTKVADLETRIKLKEKDTFPRYLAAQQNNKVVIEGSKREMLKMIERKGKEKRGK